MSTFRNPVGPQPSRVYWRRRLLVLIGLVAVIAIIVLIVVQPRGGAQPGPSSTPSSSPSGQSTSTGNPTEAADAEACDPAKVTLAPVTDSNSYDAGVNPVLSFTLKSTMTVPCTVEAGSDVQEFTITSGDELIWSSRDCQTDEVAAVITLMPGVPKQGPSLTWDRTRSSTDTCDSERPPVTADGASYHLGVKVGELTSAETRQFLLY
jgi:hypothetical protein